MPHDRLKTAREEALEMAKVKLPTSDPRREHERLIDSTLRMLGVTPHDQTVPGEEPHDDSDNEASQDLGSLPEMLGGPVADTEIAPSELFSIDDPAVHDLPTALAELDDGQDFEIPNANADMPKNEA
jgi:hypothetical protein